MANSHRLLVMQRQVALAWLLLMAIAPAQAYDWLQFGGNPQHSGNNTAETILTPANVGTLVQKYQALLPAIADGAPVYLEAVTTPGGVRNLLFVTTRDGRIIALDAQTGATLWSHQYGPGACQINGTGGACYTTSSPAIDPNRAYVYSYGLDGNVHKYQVGDGTEVITGGWPQNATLKGYDEKGSSALSTATSAGTTYLYVTHGGYPGDNGDYQGHVTAINLVTGAQKVFNAACSDQPAHMQPFGGGVPPTCATRQNAMWARPGVIYDAGTDRIFMGTGNAFNGTPGQFDGNHNWSESVIALHPDATGGIGASTGKPLDSYTPTNHASLDSADADVGSTAPAILPVPPSSIVQHLAVQGGKDSTLRLLNLQDLSGQGNPGNVGGEIGSIINVPQGGVVLSQPAVWVNPADSSTWIFVVNGSGASGVRLNFDGSGNPSLSAQWHNGQSGTSPVIANNMVFSIGGSNVRALDPLTGIQLWSAARGGSTHWQSVIVANGAVYATDQANHLAAFGLQQSPSTTTLLSSLNPSLVGASVTFTAIVAGTAPTGTVAFTDGGATISGCGAMALFGSGNTRTAICSTSSLSVATHTIVASYAGDAGNSGSTATLSQVVNSAPPVSLINGSFEIPALGSGYRFSPNAPGVGWTFIAHGGIQGNGSAWGATPAPTGTQTAVIQSTGSMAQTLSLNAGSYTLSFQAAQRSCCAPPFVQPVMVSVDGTQIGGLISPASTSFTPFSISFTVGTGSHTITFTGTSKGDRTTFIDNVNLVLGNQGSTTTTVASSATPSLAGASVTFTATVNGTAPTSAVAFTTDSTTVTGCGAVSFTAGSTNAPTAVCSTSALSAGVHSIVATYSGDAGNSGSISTPLSQVVSIPVSLVNGSFEIPALGSSFQYNPSASGIGWTFSPNSGIQGNGSAWGATPAPTGTQTAFIQQTSSMSQTITLNAGSYTLSFQAAQRSCCLPPFVLPVMVSVDGTQIGGLISPESTSFAPYRIPFTIVTTGPHTVTFTGTDINDKTTFIDNVSIQ